jgi:hypothetical protein
MNNKIKWHWQYLRDEDLWYLTELHDEDGILGEHFFESSTEMNDYIVKHDIPLLPSTAQHKRNEKIKKYRDERKIYVDSPKNQLGGQSCGMITYPTVVEHEELGIRISIGYDRANYKNKDLAITLFDIAFDEIIKR